MPAYPDDRSAEISASLGALPSGTPVSEVARRLMDLFTSGSIEPGTRLPPERHLATTPRRRPLGGARGARRARDPRHRRRAAGVGHLPPRHRERAAAADAAVGPADRGEEHGRAARTALRARDLRRAARRRRVQVPPNSRPSPGRSIACAPTSTNLKAFARADLDFHHALGVAAGNDTLVDLLHVVRSLLQVYADRAVHDEAEAPRRDRRARRRLSGGAVAVTRMRRPPPWPCTWRRHPSACRPRPHGSVGRTPREGAA